MDKKKYKKKAKKTGVEEPKPSYETSMGENNRITITTFEELEQMDIEHARNRTHEQRMEYLQKLIYNLWGPDLSKQEKELKKGKLTIRKAS